MLHYQAPSSEVDRLLYDLENGSPRIRRQAAQELARLQFSDDRIVPALRLAAALDPVVSDVARQGIRALGDEAPLSGEEPEPAPSPKGLGSTGAGDQLKQALKRVWWEAMVPLMLLVAGVAGVAYGGRSMTVTCTRAQPSAAVTCLKQERLMWVLPLDKQEIPGVWGVRLEVQTVRDRLEQAGGSSDTFVGSLITSYLSGPENIAYRIELLTARGRIPLTDDFVDDEDSAATARRQEAAKLEAFFQNRSADKLVIAEPVGFWWTFWAGLAFPLGVLMTLASVGYFVVRIVLWLRPRALSGKGR